MLAGLAIWTAAASLFTAFLYVWDKRAAIRNRPRIPERTLLTCSLVGGWPGGLAASQMLRHKTQKMSFRVKFAFCVAVNVVGVAALIFAAG